MLCRASSNNERSKWQLLGRFEKLRYHRGVHHARSALDHATKWHLPKCCQDDGCVHAADFAAELQAHSLRRELCLRHQDAQDRHTSPEWRSIHESKSRRGCASPQHYPTPQLFVSLWTAILCVVSQSTAVFETLAEQLHTVHLFSQGIGHDKLRVPSLARPS
jgi:hypothetical protein